MIEETITFLLESNKKFCPKEHFTVNGKVVPISHVFLTLLIYYHEGGLIITAKKKTLISFSSYKVVNLVKEK